MTQAQLAERANLSNTYIANIECGKAWISDTTLEKLSVALDTDFYLFFMQEDGQKAAAAPSCRAIVKKYKKELQQASEALFAELEAELCRR